MCNYYQAKYESWMISLGNQLTVRLWQRSLWFYNYGDIPPKLRLQHFYNGNLAWLIVNKHHIITWDLLQETNRLSIATVDGQHDVPTTCSVTIPSIYIYIFI